MISILVEGAPLHEITQTVPCASPSTSSTQPYYKQFGTKKDSTFTVKVVKANMKKLLNGKAEFERLKQTHINLDDWSANITTVSSAVQEKWGTTYVVVTGDGLEVDGSVGTQGDYKFELVIITIQIVKLIFIIMYFCDICYP